MLIYEVRGPAAVQRVTVAGGLVVVAADAIMTAYDLLQQDCACWGCEDNRYVGATAGQRVTAAGMLVVMASAALRIPH